MNSDPWFRFFPSDWIAGVSGLSAAERGVYVTLLAIMYDRASPVQRDDVRLSRQCGLPKAGFTRALDALIATGKIATEAGNLFNARVKNELTERENRKLTASKSASSRWNKHQSNQSSFDANALPTHSECNATRARVPQPQLDIRKKERAEDGLKVLDPDGALFEAGLKILGKTSGGQIVKLKALFNGDIERTRQFLDAATLKADPREYIAATIRKGSKAQPLEQQTRVWAQTA